MIDRIFIQNFKIFQSFDLGLNDGLNILVGDNEVGKSTVLEAINLALTRRLNGRQIDLEMTPYLFNREVAGEYVASLKTKTPKEPPPIRIELYLQDTPEFQQFRGSMNSKREDCPGLKLEILFDDDYSAEYAALLKEPNVKLVPAEYYRAHWQSFANNAVTQRSLPVALSYIDTTTIRLQSGADYYVQDLIRSNLTPKERVGLSMSYRKLKETFSGEPGISEINRKLTSHQGAITDKGLSISIDISQKANWETNLVPHLDDLPFHQVGKGEQNALKVMLALDRKADDSSIILIEEPENHLSFSSMNVLVRKIRDKCGKKQVIITTHSGFVLNKLGLESLILLANSNGATTSTLSKLSEDTQNYFKKLSGYDTLRLVLAKKAILVEGPSDELIVQKAFLTHHGSLPIEQGVDVISVRGLSFRRFIEIAMLLAKDLVVVTDNDGDFAHKVEERYSKFKDMKNIRICASQDNALPTLEPQIAACNDLAHLNKILETEFENTADLVGHMVANKTECALKLFETKEALTFPSYILDAIK
ncbi:MAG TPA: AAA family ATPase [Candidatus Kryptobacter bacterium]|nr:AAA family ATPase [Candidatus Kryptobacter bacterium]